MSSNEEDKSSSESETTVRPKPFSKAPIHQDLGSEFKFYDEDSSKTSKSSSSSPSSVNSTDEENEDERNQYYRKMQVITDEMPISEIIERRLDTVEEITEPLSSGYFLESLGAECAFPKFSHQEEVYGTSEVEVANSTKSFNELISIEELENQFQNVAISDRTNQKGNNEEGKQEDGNESLSSSASTSPIPCSSERNSQKIKGKDKKAGSNFSSLVDISCSGLEEKSVSIQSPSDIVPNVLKNQIFELLTPSDDEEEHSSSRVLMYRASDDSEYSLEKHEFENDEKNSSIDKIDVVLEERTDVTNTRVELSLFEEIGTMSPIMDNDSGVEGLSNTSKSTYIWNKLNKRLKPKNSNHSAHVAQVNSKDCSSGCCSSTISMLNLQIKELHSRLSQVEVEKQKIADEAYHRTVFIQNEATQKIESVHRAQSKQANLVHRLQRKLVEMKKNKEDLENKLLEMGEVSLTTQSKFDDSKEILKAHEETLRSLKSQHSNEKEALEARNEELSHKLQTAHELNAHLQKQLNGMQLQNESLIESVGKCENHWQDLKSQFELQEKSMEERINRYLSSNVDKSDHNVEENKLNLLSVSNKMSSLRRKCIDLKMESEKDILKLRNELWRESKNIVASCLIFQSASKYIICNGEKIHIGSSEELYEKLQRLTRDKKSLENATSQLESKNKDLSNQIQSLQMSLSLKNEIIQAHKDTNEGDMQLSSVPLESVVNESVQSISQLEEYNNQLEASLHEIAQLVLDDAHRNIREIDHPILALNSSHHLSLLNLSSGDHLSSSNRVRSTSLDITEFTPAVQAALNRRQVQVHDLRVKLQSCQDRLLSATKKVQDKSESLDVTERTLEIERQEFDSLKIKIEELSEDKYKALEKVETLLLDKVNSDKSIEILKQELLSLNNDIATLKDVHDEDLRTIECQAGKLSSLLITNTTLNVEVDELRIEIMNLQEANTALRKDLLEKKEALEAATQALELVNHEKDHYMNKSTIVSKEQRDYESQMISFKKQESVFKSNISFLEEERLGLRRNIQELDESILELKTENESLLSDNHDKNSQIKLLKESMSECDAKSRELELQYKSIKDMHSTEKMFREKVEKELMSIREEKNGLDDSLAALTLCKASLEDEVSHAQEKILQMKEQHNRISKENLEINRFKLQLDIKLEKSSRDIASLTEALNDAQAEKFDILKFNESYKRQIDKLNELIKSLELDKDELSSKCQLQAESIRNLKSELNDETLSKQVILNTYESKLSELECDYESKMQKIGMESSQRLEEMTSEKRNLEIEIKARIEQEYDERIAIKDKEIASLSKKVERAEEKIKFLKSKIQEDLILAENAKQKALTMIEQEKSEYVEKATLLANDLDALHDEFKEYKQNSIVKSEESRKNLLEVKSQLSKLKSELKDQRESFEEERTQLQSSLKMEKELNSRLNEDVQSKSLNYTKSKNSLDELQIQISRLEASLTASKDEEVKLSQDLLKRDKTISELKHESELMERSKQNLQEKCKLLEIEKIDLKSKSQEDAQEIQQYKIREGDLMNELNEVKSKLEEHSFSLQRKDTYSSEIDRNFHEIKQRYRELEDNYKSIAQITQEEKDLRKKYEIESQEKISKLTDLKSQQEWEISSLRQKLLTEEQSSRKKIERLENALAEARNQKREFENQCSELELRCITAEDKIHHSDLDMNGAEARISEMNKIISKLESEKKSLKSKLSTIISLMDSHSLGGEQLNYEEENEEDNISIKLFKSKLRVWVSNISILENEKHDLKGSLTVFEEKLKNSTHQKEDLANRNSELAEQIKKYEEQLRKMSKSLSTYDAQLANQDEEIQRKETQIRSLSEELKVHTKKSRYSHYDSTTKKSKCLEAYETERKKLLEDHKQLEDQLSKARFLNQSLEGDKQRLEMRFSQKDRENKALKDKNERLSKSLNSSNAAEASLQNKIRRLENHLDDQASYKKDYDNVFLRLEHQSLSSNEASNLIKDLEKGKRELEDKLSHSQCLIDELQLNQKKLGRQAARHQFGNIADKNNLLEEQEFLKNRLNYIHEQIDTFKNDNAQLRRIQMEHVRPQVPFNIDQNSPLQCREHLSQIRNLKREVEVQKKKVDVLEQKLIELKNLYSSRLKEALQIRHEEKEKDRKRHREYISEQQYQYQQLEQNYKDKISKLEQEILTLKEKLDQEAYLRRSFISSGSRVSNEISDLHLNLGQSLNKIASLDIGKDLLVDETLRLNQTADLHSSIINSTRDTNLLNESRAIKRSRSINNICLCSTPKPSPQRKHRSPHVTKKSINFD